MTGSSSFCARIPICLEFLVFGDSYETADVLNFIEQCEKFLEIGPLPSTELLGTLTTVLRGPAQSWWKAEKAKVTDWKQRQESKESSRTYLQQESRWGNPGASPSCYLSPGRACESEWSRGEGSDSNREHLYINAR